ncbi:MAG TPA: hypothetical protein VFF21_04510 [Flavobacteriaceae bacterium]|nr:hypothetical protein [Flavobacteriaceae bacterium]
MQKRNWLEATVTVFSAVIVLFVFGYLLFQLITKEPSDPDLFVEIGTPEAATGHFRLPIIVKNKGTKTAENVKVQIRHSSKSGEGAQLEFDYIPGESEVYGAATFKENPDIEFLDISISGYVIP